MTTAYIVCGEAGYPEDNNHWVVHVWLDKAAADAHARHLQQAVDALCPRDPFTNNLKEPYDGLTYGPTMFDPQSGWRARGPRPYYHVEEAPFGTENHDHLRV